MLGWSVELFFFLNPNEETFHCIFIFPKGSSKKQPMFQRISLLIILFFSFKTNRAQVKKLTAETTIQQVTVYSSGARVERTASVNIQTGRSEIIFAGLSNQLDQQTVQLKADANITLLSVQATKDFLTAGKIDQEVKDFMDRMNSLQDKFNMDNKLLDVYKNEEAMLIKNQEIGGQAGVKTTELKEALDFQKARLTDVYGKELEIQKRLKSEGQEMDKYIAQLREISKKKDSISYIVTALVDNKETRTVNFQLLYNVKDAGWYPTYDIRVSEITAPLNVVMNANVFQRSGESWKNISLQLSTGSPNDNATPTNLEPWPLGFYDPSVSVRTQGTRGEISGRVTNEKGEPINGAFVTIKASGKSTVTDVNGFFKMQSTTYGGVMDISYVGYEPKEIALRPGYFSIALKENVQALNEVVVIGYTSAKKSGADEEAPVANRKMVQSLQFTAVSTPYQPTTTVYKIDDKYTLETDGKTTTIGIKQLAIPAQYDYYVAPKADPTAFLTAKLVNWQDYDLQSGEASLYFEGAYLGKTYLDLSTTTDTLSISLGKDNGIKIYRKLIKEYSTKKFIGGNRTDSRQYEISVRNNKHDSVNITVVDQFPVSVTKEITVDDMKAANAQIDKDSGIVSWVITLAPGQEIKLAIGFSVKYPKDRKVVLE